MACQKHGIEVPISRSFEPAERVYKLCLGGVIVVAIIPKDAHVRGGYNRECRASKALVEEIKGDFYGEKIGISIRNEVTTYCVGDMVQKGDFDLGDTRESTGFHFYNSIEEVRRYIH